MTVKQARYIAREFRDFRLREEILTPFFPLEIGKSADLIRRDPFEKFPVLLSGIVNKAIETGTREKVCRVLAYCGEFTALYYHPEYTDLMEPGDVYSAVLRSGK